MTNQHRWALLGVVLMVLAFWCAAQLWTGAGQGAALAAAILGIASVLAIVRSKA